jgi:tetratricopeptide (TPR) repeat protein
VHPATAGARICFLLADRTTGDLDRQEKLAAEGVRWGEIALADSSKPDGVIHYYLAVNLGLAIRNHAALAVKNLKRLAAEFERAKDLAPQEDLGGPLRALGMLYLMAPQWPQGIGDGDKALELLGEAVQRYPQHPLNHIFYARALWDLEEDDAIEKVKAHLEKGHELIERGEWGSARERWLKELEEVAEEAEVSVGGGG